MALWQFSLLGGAHMKLRRTSNSPLLDPSVCALVLIAPDTSAFIDSETHAICKRAIATVTQAAETAHVPVFVLSHASEEQHSSTLQREPSTPWQSRFIFEEDVSPWSHKPFVEALTAADRSILVLAGFWLELEILATALHALVDAYDVYVLLDATAPRCPHASEPSMERLNQAGATPVITSQVIHEWSLETSDASSRAALRSLLPALMKPQ
jgi:nicotinamidase-related amidase